MSILKSDHDEDNYPVPPHLMEPTDPAERKRRLDQAEASIAAGHGVPLPRFASG